MDFSSILSPAVRLPVLYIGITLLAVAQMAQAGDARMPSEFAWFESDKDITESFSRGYSECIAGQNTFAIKLGRLAFNSPRLLGGQAARMKISCASCHPSGRANERFFISQISSVPGTADISHSFLSSAGGDGVFNPKVIPDLADRNAMQNSDRYADNFAFFMQRLVEVEFDGRKPPRAIFDALLTYLQSTDQDYCGSHKPVSALRQRVTLLQEALALVKDIINLQVGDDELRFAVSSTRSQLENLYEIYGLAPSARLDRMLIKLSHGLDDILAKESTESRSRQLAKVTNEMSTLLELLETHEATSAFNHSALAAYLKADKKKAKGR